MQKIYSGYIFADQGRAAPVSFDGPAGWTVFKAQSTELYIVNHHLELAAGKRLHIVATTTVPRVTISIDAMDAVHFTLSAIMADGSPIPIGKVDVSFVAVLN